ncbi:MAG: 30S ribosomal protein S15 [Methanothrix sp.]|jgi:small subunit ribosomal protein S15
MARMHTKKKGKSKSRKPILEQGVKIEGAEENKEQIIKLAVDYAKQGMPPALIGEKLKKEHNVPYVRHILGKKLEQVLKENGIEESMPYDMLELMKKAVNLRKHMAKNKQDVNNRIRLNRIEAKIWRLTKYYIREGVLPEKWRYNPQQAELLVKGH